MTDWMRRWSALQQAQESTQSIAASTLVCELVAEIERLKSQVEQVSTHAEKWVKRATTPGSLATKLGHVLVNRGIYDRMKDLTQEDTAERVVSEFLALANPIVAEHWHGGQANQARELAASAYQDGYGAALTDDRDLSERTHELMRQLSRPAHEREPPHCPTCECWEADAKRAALEPAAESTELMQWVEQWAEAYPLDMFPKPDLHKAREVLSAAGLSLDCISADAMRHVITRVRDRMRAAQPPAVAQQPTEHAIHGGRIMTLRECMDAEGGGE